MRKLIVIFLLTVGIPLHLSLLATTVLAQELSDDDSEFYDFEDDDFDDFTDLGDVKNVEPSDFEAAPKHAEVEKAAPEEENLISERPTADLEKIQPGIAYAKFDYKPSPWRIYVDYGYQFANVEKTFTSSIPLPEEYNMLGGELNYHPLDSRFYFGTRLQQFSETVRNTLVQLDYKLNLLTAVIGFKVVEQIVTVSPHAGLVFGVGGTATTKVLASGVTSEDTFTMAISYVAGVQTIVNLKGLQIGADAGYFMINDQKLDATDFSFNLGGYARGLLGMKF